jgi:hypothetical protein
MKKVSEYIILASAPPERLQQEVVEHILQGWQPLGGVSVTQLNLPVTDADNITGFYLAQAMVKYEE